MNKKNIKAVRTVLGFTDDLRIELNGADKDAIFDFLDNNRHGIFGINSELAEKPNWDDEGWESWERAMWREVGSAISGNETT
jgi:hypothetical protein